MNKIKKIAIVAVIVALIIIIATIIWYKVSIMPVIREEKEIEVNIPLGSGTNKIAEILKEEDIIRNKLAFKIYVRLNKVTNFQAGNYYLKQNMSLKEVIETLRTGIVYDPNQITITFLEGKNFRWIAKKIEEETNNTQREVYDTLKNEEYIDSLIEKYWFLTEDIKNKNIYYSLEGYLFPDTYNYSNKDVTVEEIFETMLDRMKKILDNYKAEIENSKYDIHQILTIASIIETESVTKEGRKDVSSVIYNRLKKDMAIQSDVTTYYAIKVDVGERDLYQKELNTYNAYNTRGPNMEGKLPVGPISSVGKSSIEAAIFPNDTDYLFFVADKKGKLYFTKNDTEHNSIIKKLQEENMWFEY